MISPSEQGGMISLGDEGGVISSIEHGRVLVQVSQCSGVYGTDVDEGLWLHKNMYVLAVSSTDRPLFCFIQEFLLSNPEEGVVLDK